MIEQGATEVKSFVNVVVNIGNPANDLVQIAQHSFCEDEAVIHSCICLRTSSIGTVRPFIGIPDAFVNGREGLFVLLIKDRSRVFKIEFLGLSHIPNSIPNR